MVASCISEISTLWCGPQIDNIYEKQVGGGRLHLRSLETLDTGDVSQVICEGGLYCLKLYIF